MAENSKTAEQVIPCFVCLTQDICRDKRECVQKDAWGAGAAAGGESRA
jgi:hypothetical protein